GLDGPRRPCGSDKVTAPRRAGTPLFAWKISSGGGGQRGRDLVLDGEAAAAEAGLGVVRHRLDAGFRLVDQVVDLVIFGEKRGEGLVRGLEGMDGVELAGEFLSERVGRVGHDFSLSGSPRS